MSWKFFIDFILSIRLRNRDNQLSWQNSPGRDSPSKGVRKGFNVVDIQVRSRLIQC